MGRRALKRQYAHVAFKPLAFALALAFSPGARPQDAYAPLIFSPPPHAAPPVSAPPLPFRYVGRLVQNGRAEAALIFSAT